MAALFFASAIFIHFYNLGLLLHVVMILIERIPLEISAMILTC